MGILLYIIAIILFNPLTLLNLIVVLYKYGCTWKVFNGYFKQTAIDIDRFGNHNFRTLLNTLLITEEGYQFGNFKETISSALGKNKRDNTLTKLGKIICSILNFIDKNHVEKSINLNVN